MANPPPADPPPLLTRRYLRLYPALGVVLSLILVPICYRLLNSDHFLPVILLFPLPTAAAFFFNGNEILVCIFASLQFPLYGLLLGYGHGIDGLPSFSVGLLIAHIVSVGFSFLCMLR